MEVEQEEHRAMVVDQHQAEVAVEEWQLNILQASQGFQPQL
jgi:hypothetical protein